MHFSWHLLIKIPSQISRCETNFRNFFVNKFTLVTFFLIETFEWVLAWFFFINLINSQVFYRIQIQVNDLTR